MKELKCPECGKVFTVNEADYASIANQVKNAEFHTELEKRLVEMKALSDAESKAMLAEAEKAYQEGLSGKNAEIEKMRSALKQSDDAVKIAVLQERAKLEALIHDKEMELSSLRAQNEADKSQAAVREAEIREQYARVIKDKDDMISSLQDMRTRMSTKMVGETLEIHCSTLFNQMLRPLMPDAYFEKDNDASGGSKGDFIFRDFSEGTEYVSIMFEMKNEMDTTATKHRNEDFLKKLDEDRRAKGCEYAVLVSMLEKDSELYNCGIVDMSHRYPKMYVIRPQFFLPMITLLVQASKNTIDYRRQLEVARNQSIDVSRFEKQLQDFQSGFSKNCQTAEKYFEYVIKDLDNAISSLEKMKKDLTTTGNQLRLANNKALDISIRKLTYKNPTMQTMFAEAALAEESSTITESHDGE